MRRGLGARFEGIPDVSYGDDAHFVSGEPRRLGMDVTATTVDGERIDVRGCDLWTFGDGGEIVRKDSFWKIREA